MKACKECGRTVQGRADKQYCDDYCRSAFHNKKYKGLNHEIRGVNAILRHNRAVLSRLYVDEMSLVSRNQLIAEGFDFRYATHSGKHGENQCKFCYEYGLVTLGSAMCGIITEKSA